MLDQWEACQQDTATALVTRAHLLVLDEVFAQQLWTTKKEGKDRHRSHVKTLAAATVWTTQRSAVYVKVVAPGRAAKGAAAV